MKNPTVALTRIRWTLFSYLVRRYSGDRFAIYTQTIQKYTQRFIAPVLRNIINQRYIRMNRAFIGEKIMKPFYLIPDFTRSGGSQFSGKCKILLLFFDRKRFPDAGNGSRFNNQTPRSN